MLVKLSFGSRSCDDDRIAQYCIRTTILCWFITFFFTFYHISAFLLNPTGTQTVTHWSNKMFTKTTQEKNQQKRKRNRFGCNEKVYTYRNCKMYDTVIRSSKKPITIRIKTILQKYKYNVLAWVQYIIYIL